MKIGSRDISDDSPAFVVAEAASNHMCDLSLARRLIDEAAMAGADAIKFQTFKAERLVREGTPSFWKGLGGAKTQLEYYKNFDKFGEREYRELFEYAAEKGIAAFSTPFDTGNAAMLNDLGAVAFKIASCDIMDTRLLKTVAGFNKPVILSTGASTLPEIEKAVRTVLETGNRDLALLVCTLSYPTENPAAHLRRITTFKAKFPDLVIGLSDHTRPDERMIIPSIAVALGARIIEKHYTLDRKMEGPGHAFAIEPKELKMMIENIKLAETVLGQSDIKVYAQEEAARKGGRRAIVADRDIRKGEKISSADIGMKRPCDGLSADRIDEVVGRTAAVDIKKDTPIRLEELK